MDLPLLQTSPVPSPGPRAGPPPPPPPRARFVEPPVVPSPGGGGGHGGGGAGGSGAGGGPPDRRQQIRDQFQVFDKDQSGTIDRNELRGAMSALGFEPSDEEFMRMFMDMDTDGNGQVEFDEYFDWMTRYDEHATDRHLAMQLYDLLKDRRTNKIAFRQLKAAAAGSGEQFDDNLLLDMLGVADLNGDGQIDEDEFMAIYRRAFTDTRPEETPVLAAPGGESNWS